MDDEKNITDNLNEQEETEMSEHTDSQDVEEINEAIDEVESTDYHPVNRFDASVVHHLSGM